MSMCVTPLIQYPSFPTVFSSSSAVFCQDVIDSCAKAGLSDVCFVFGPGSIGLVSVSYVSQVDTHLSILRGKMSDDTEISSVISLCRLRFNGVSQVSVDLRRPGGRPAFLLLYRTSIIAADNELFA